MNLWKTNPYFQPLLPWNQNFRIDFHQHFYVVVDMFLHNHYILESFPFVIRYLTNTSKQCDMGWQYLVDIVCHSLYVHRGCNLVKVQFLFFRSLLFQICMWFLAYQFCLLQHYIYNVYSLCYWFLLTNSATSLCYTFCYSSFYL